MSTSVETFMRGSIPTTTYPHRASIALALLLALSACSGSGDEKPVRVYAAASMTSVIDPLGHKAFNGPFGLSTGASSTLARQIEDGAPADVFVCAGRDWIDYLVERDLVEGEAIMFATTDLVCIANPAYKTAVSDMAQLGEALGVIGIADAGVPAGEYARQTLDSAGILKQAEPRLVGLADVRAVLKAVESGDVNFGFVYATDALHAGDRVQLLFTVDSKLHDPIEFYAVQIKASDRPEIAARFMEFLTRGPAARQKLREQGFKVP
jgi:molybdate transport system substrate-binding protein